MSGYAFDGGTVLVSWYLDVMYQVHHEDVSEWGRCYVPGTTGRPLLLVVMGVNLVYYQSTRDGTRDEVGYPRGPGYPGTYLPSA